MAAGSEPFNDLLDRVVAREGGFVDHPDDRGGPTKYGITAATLGAARQLRRAATSEEVQALDREEAKAIYRRQYLTEPGFDRVGDRWTTEFLFDSAVHSGPTRAIAFFDRALARQGRPRVTLTDLDLAALPRDERAWRRLRPRLLAERLEFLGELVTNRPRQAALAHGWARRLGTFARDLP